MKKWKDVWQTINKDVFVVSVNFDSYWVGHGAHVTLSRHWYLSKK